MDGEVRKTLEQELVSLTEKLGKMKPESPEFRETAKAIAEIGDKINASLKIEYDYDAKVCSDERDNALKKEELDSKNELALKELEFKNRELDARIAEDKAKRRTNIFVEGGKMVVETLGVILPLKAYAKFLEQGYLFEQKGIVTSATFKNLLRFIKPKK